MSDQAKIKAQLLAELNELRQRVAHLEAAAEPLKQSEERYRSVVTAMAEGVVMYQRSGEIVACNPAAERVLGFSREQMMGQTSMDPCWRAIQPDGTPFPGETHPAMVTLQTGQPQRNVVMGVHKSDGTLTWILINSEPLFQTGDNEPYAVIATFTDITQQRQTEVTLRESEHKFRQIVEHSNDGIILTDETGRLIEWNPAAERIFGLKRAEVVGWLLWDNLYRILPPAQQTPERYEQFKAEWLTYFQTGQHPSLNQTLELEIQQPDGTRRIMQTARFSIKTEQGYLLSAVIRDVAEHKRLEAALRASKERLDMVIEAADLGTWDWYTPGNRVVYNERWAEMLDYTLAELEPAMSGWENLIHPEDVARVRAAVNAHIAGDTLLYQTEQRLRSKSGEWKWVLATGKVVERDEQGQPVRAVGIHQDITARKQAEAALQESEQKYRQLVELAQEGIWRIDAAAYTTYVNPRMAEILGYTVDEMMGRHLFSFMDEPGVKLAQTNLERRREGVAEQHDFEFIRRDGQRIYTLLSVAPITDEAGSYAGAVAMATDITVRKQAEATLRESEYKLKTIFELLPVGVSILDTDRKIAEVNPALEKILSITGEGLVRGDYKARHYLRPDGTNMPAAEFASSRAFNEQQAVYDIETGVVKEDGSLTWTNVSAVPVDFADWRVIIVTSDITARKRTEIALRASEEKFRQIIEHSGDAVILYNETGQLEEWNPAAERLTGLARSAVLGRPITEVRFGLLPAEQRTPAAYEQFKAGIQAYLQPDNNQKLAWSTEYSIQRADGSYRDVQSNYFFFKTEWGFSAGSINRDVTEQKQTEQIEAAQFAVSRVLAESPEPEAALRRVLESIATRLEWDLAKLWWPNNDGSRLVWREGWRAPAQPELAEFEQTSRAYTFAPGEGLAGVVWQTGQAIWDQNLHLPKLASIALAAGLHSAIGIPIIRDGETVGVMTFFSRSARPLEERLLTVLTDLGRQMGQFLAHRQAEAALRESKERLELVMAGADLGTWDEHIPNGTVIYNERWAEMLEYTLAEIKPQINSWERLIHPDDFAHVVQAAQANLEGQTSLYQAEYRIQTKSGRWKWILATGKVLVRDEQGRAVRAAGIHQDITARKQTEENLRRYEQMVSISPDLVVMVDHHYIHQIANQAFLELNNKTYDQIIGHSVAEVQGEVMFAKVIKPRLDQVLAGETIRYQEWIDTPSAGRRFIDVTSSPYREKDGAITGVIVSGRDATESKLLEERLNQAKKMEMVGQLAAGMAHHYNSMLTTIIGFTSLVLDQLPPGNPQAKRLGIVLKTAERMAVLVRQLLAFARKQLLQPQTVNLNDLIIQLQAELKQRLPTSVEFITRLTAEVDQVKIDPRQFEYLLQALVSNAIDVMPQGGQLTLSTTNVRLGAVNAGRYDLTPSNYILLTIQDTGIGLSDQVKAHLFEPFFTTKEIGQGTGLGLAMSLGIAKQHGGHLLAEGQPGQGAVFMLYLPCLAPTVSPVQST